jgi:hypothetical protein
MFINTLSLTLAIQVHRGYCRRSDSCGFAVVKHFRGEIHGFGIHQLQPLQAALRGLSKLKERSRFSPVAAA